jgi:hypothetical protein
LQRELSAEKEKIQELDATHKRLAEMEHVCRELREENRGLEEEISRWQERLAGSPENQRQISTLRQQIDELQTKQEPLIDRSHDASSRRISDPDLSYARQSTTNTAGELTPEPIDSAFIHQVARIPFGMAVSEANSPINGLGGTNGDHLSPGDSGATIHVTNEEEIKPAVRTSGKRKWPLAMIPGTVVIVIACALALGFLGTSSDKFSRSKEPAAALETASGEQWTPSEAASDKPKRPTPASVSALGKNEFSKQIRGSKPATRLRGTFKISRPTEVYNGPSENSALIASIEPGMKINVVDSRDGWLEIRSKHGRPPGFVRQEAAVRINQNEG